MYQDAALQSLEDHKRENAQFTHSLDFSNFSFPAHDQFSAFRSAYQGVMDLSAVLDDPQSFPARQRVWNLNRLVFLRTELPGGGRSHRRKHLKGGSLDHWYISLPFRAARDRPEAERAVPELHCLATPFETELDHDGVLTLFIPQDLFASTGGLFPMPDGKVERGLGKLLADYLFLLDRSLADLRSEEIPALAEATRSLVAACLAPSRDRLAEARAPVDATLLARARRLIDGRLGDRSLPCEMLCAELGVSRSRLYRLFGAMAELPPTFESSGCCEHAMRCPIWRIRGRYPASRRSGVSWTLPHSVAPSGMNSAFRRRKRAISDGQAWASSLHGITTGTKVRKRSTKCCAPQIEPDPNKRGRHAGEQCEGNPISDNSD